MTKEKKKKVWEYSAFHSFKLNGKESSMTSQIYSIGLYVIYDNNSTQQGGHETPQPIVNLQKKLRKAEKAGEITDLHFSPPIKVTTDDDGFLIQLS
jgi:hypothetical protein